MSVKMIPVKVYRSPIEDDIEAEIEREMFVLADIEYRAGRRTVGARLAIEAAGFAA